MRTYDDYLESIDKGIELTIAIITYNRSSFLSRTIDSVLKQSYSSFLLLVLDNASTDDTKTIVDGFDDERLFYYCQKENVGGIGNINAAFSLARTRYLIIFHDDDSMMPDLVEKEMVTIKESGCSAVSSRALMVDKDGGEIRSSVPLERFVFRNDEYFEHVVKGYESAIFPTLIYDMNFIKANHLVIDPLAGPCCDFYFISEICMNGGSLRILDEKLIVRVIHDGQDSSKSEFWMNIKVLNHFCSNERYGKPVIKLQKNIINGYVKNIRHLCANLYEKKVKKDVFEGVINEIPFKVFKRGLSKNKLRFWVFNAKYNKFFTCFLCHTIRKIIRKRKAKKAQK